MTPQRDEMGTNDEITQPMENLGPNELIASSVCRGIKHRSPQMDNSHHRACRDCEPIIQALDQKDTLWKARMEKLEAELSDYKDIYNVAKSGLRKDEVHCACAFELQAKLQAHLDATLDGDCQVCDYAGFQKMLAERDAKLTEAEGLIEEMRKNFVHVNNLTTDSHSRSTVMDWIAGYARASITAIKSYREGK